MKNYARFLNPVSARRQPSAIRKLQPLLAVPGMISLGGGMPHPSTFPFRSMTIELTTGKTLSISAADTALALQYSATAGLPELVKFLRELQQREHEPKGYGDADANMNANANANASANANANADGNANANANASQPPFDMCVFNGSQEGLAKAFEMLITPGDHVLVESPMYSGALAIVKPMDCKLIDVPTDHQGIIPDRLAHILATATVRPKLLYTVPTACNPTGASTSIERKRAIYKMACEYDLLIIEDDPYYFLQFGTDDNPNKDDVVPRTPSYFSMDTERRVLRFDSFSKILSSGMRLGFATGPQPLIERLVLHSQSTALHANGISQVLAIALFREWGHAGFLDHVTAVSAFYRRKRDMLLHSCRTHLSDLADWHTPTAGMFLWLKLRGVADSKALVEERAVKEKRVLLLPGVEFMPNGEKGGYVRAAYSTASEEQMDEAMKRLAELLREVPQQ